MRKLAALVLAAGVVAGCSSGGGSSSSSSASSSTSGTDAGSATFCRQLNSLSPQLAAKLGGSKGPTTRADFDTLADLYAQVINVAPPAVKPAVTDLVAALREGAQAVADPAKPDVAKLQDFEARLAADAKKMTDFTRPNCK